MFDFDNVLYAVLDMPILPFVNRQEITKIYHQHRDDITKKENSTSVSYWQGITCYKSALYDPKNLLYPGPHIDLSYLIQDEITILTQHLPIDIETISLWTNSCFVPSHVDAKIYDTDLDFRFRFVLSQEKKSFFVDYEGVKKYISLPATSNVFCFNNAVIKHGATYDETNNKILGVIRGKIINQEKLKILIQQSLDKYPDLCFLKSNYKN
jgi:hypothetical protein